TTDHELKHIITTSKNDIVIKINYKNIERTFEKGNLLLKKIEEENIRGIANLRMGIEKGEPEYKIIVDKEKCLAYGINITEAANQVVNIVKGNEAAFFSDFD